MQIKAAVSFHVCPNTSATEGASTIPSSPSIMVEGSSLIPSPSPFAMDKQMSVPKAELNWLQVPMVRSVLLALMRNVVKLSAKSKPRSLCR